MKIRILTLLFSAFIIGASYAHDDLVYRTASEWSFDAGNQSTISETYGSAWAGRWLLIIMATEFPTFVR